MNLPKGPDTLCFDKDEFMKVRAGAPLPEPAAGGLPSFRSGASSGRARSGPAPGGTSLLLAVGLLVSGVAGAAWGKHHCEIVRSERKSLEVVCKWF